MYEERKTYMETSPERVTASESAAQGQAEGGSQERPAGVEADRKRVSLKHLTFGIIISRV